MQSAFSHLPHRCQSLYRVAPMKASSSTNDLARCRFRSHLGSTGCIRLNFAITPAKCIRQMVTAYVFYNYRVGDYFNDLQPPPVQSGKEMRGPMYRANPELQEPPIPFGPEPMRTRRPTGQPYHPVRNNKRSSFDETRNESHKDRHEETSSAHFKAGCVASQDASLTQRLIWFRQPLSGGIIAMVRDTGFEPVTPTVSR